MADVLLSTDDLTVLGGPASISVDLDFGPSGDRGSQIFVGNGNPNITEIGQDPLAFDMYINLQSGDEYLYMYQYQNVDGVMTWKKLFKLIPNTYSLNSTGTFSAGSRTINIPVINIVPLSSVANLTAANFNIQYSVLGQNPVASGLSVGELTTVDDIVVLPVTIEGLEYSSGSWSELSGQKTVHLFISVV